MIPCYTEVAIQVVIIYVGGAAFTVHQIPGSYWGISIALGLVSIPLGFLIRLIPNGPIEKLFIKLHIMDDPNSLPEVNPQAEKYNEAIENVRSDLGIFANIRGGRVRGASISFKSRRARMRDAKIQLPQLMTMVPTLIAAGVGARWQPKGPLYDPANGDPSKSSAALWNGKLQLHPDTPSNHPAYAKWGAHVEKRTGTPPRGNTPPSKLKP